MKKIFTSLLLLALPMMIAAQGWPANYGGVMLQGFYWDSYTDTQWANLEKNADEISQYFNLIWVPNSANCNNTSNNMGYLPYYYFNQNSSFGTEAGLRSMIKTYKDKGTGIIADVVVNHHNTDGWFDFPSETYNGKTYQFMSTDIVSDDDVGKTSTEAAKESVTLSSNKDEGEGWDGCRDLDHKSTNVQTIIKAYVDYLANDLGYTGFRYDMVKGYDGSHVADYNYAAGVSYSVGEYWDSNAKIEGWINATGKKSAAFDFQFRYNVRDAANGGDWSKLKSTDNLIHDANYRQYAVTFVENHDTQYRSSAQPLDPIKQDTLAANAVLLAMPGTPCVFLTHWKAYKQEIKAMIDARKAAGITNMSDYTNMRSTASYFSNKVTGSNGDLIFVVGNTTTYVPSSSSYTNILSGKNYKYYLSKSMETAWADKASGTYDAAFDVNLSAVSADANAKVVYTLDGSDPTTSSTQAASGTSVSISGSCTLKVGVLTNGKVTGIISRSYTIQSFTPYQITIYCNVDNVNWSSPVNFHSWGDYRTGTTWPGDKVTATTTTDGKTWYYKKYNVTKAEDYLNLVFSTGTGSPQTVDVMSILTDKYYEISTEKSGAKYYVNDVTSAHTGITPIEANENVKDNRVYTIDGRLVRGNANGGNALQGLGKGIYIVNKKKYVIH